MNGRIEIPDPENLQDYFQDFDPTARQVGERLWRRRNVSQLIKTSQEHDYLEFHATVRDGELLQVELSYDEELGWGAFCSCESECFCEHAYAAIRELLTRSAVPTPAPARIPAAPAGPPQETLEALLRRPLLASETDIVQRVTTQYHRVRIAGCLTSWDLGAMGLDPNREAHFPPFELPWTLHDPIELLRLTLWLMEQQKLPIPPFLQPLCQNPEFQARIENRHLAKKIEHWKAVWRTVSTYELARIPVAPRMLQLRLRFTAQGAVPEWMPPTLGDTFQPLKKRDLSHIRESLSTGEALLPPGGSLLWSLLEPRCLYAMPLKLDYESPEDSGGLRRLLLQPDCASQVANTAGDPLLISKEPIRWQLTPPANPHQGSYRLQLIHQDGRPAGPFLGVLRGLPTLYLTPQTAFPGPTPPQGPIDWVREQEIPAAAVECTDGILCLHQLGVPLPQHLASQIQVDTVRVKITCRLERPRSRSLDEICVFEVVAHSKDNTIRERWTPANSWVAQGSFWQRSTKRPGPPHPTVYNRSAQERAVTLLAPLPLRPSSNGRPMLKVTKTFARTFLDWLQTVPPDIPVKLEGELASLAQDPVAAQVRLFAQEISIDWFDLRVAVDAADSQLSPEELKLLLAHPGQHVRLPAKGWHRLAFKLTENEDQQLARLGLSPHELTDEPQRLHALQLADPVARDLLPPAQIEAIQRRASEIRTRVTPSPPDGLLATLRPYQTDGFHFLAYLATNHFGGILADDMGLGKTLQTLVWIRWLHHPPSPPPSTAEPAALPPPSLVVCPKSVMHNWQAEAARFTPGLQARVWSTPDLANLADDLHTAQIHVVNYAQLRLAEAQLTAVRWLAVILDEGQFIKNPDSQTAQSARRLQAQHRLVLSGTPIENRLLDLWSLMHFAMPGVLGNRATFQRIYDASHDPLARQRLAARVRPFLLRRTKKQVARDLPDRVEEDLYCEMEGPQKTLYQAELKRARQMLLKVQTQADLAAQQFNFLTSLLRLRQICCHPALVQGSHPAASAKFSVLIEQLELLMAEGHKVLVFSQFVGLLDLLEPQLTARQWAVFRLTGATENRGEVVQAFQTAEDGAVFLLSLKAGSFGLNLTAASYVILFDPWWNPAVENQAIDRSHRIGQDRTVIAYRLLIKDSIEEKVRLLQKQKSALADDILGEERFAQALNLDDLHFLFSE